MRTIRLLFSFPDALPARSNEWALLLLLLLGADTAMAVLAWFLVGHFFRVGDFADHVSTSSIEGFSGP
jgi:hypothetical protein